MKKTLCLIFVIFVILAPLSSLADTWTCPNSACRHTGNNGNYCTMCGTARPRGGATQQVQTGSYVSFGHYPQTASGHDRTPIVWLVLQVTGNKALLLSRDGLDAMPYNQAHDEQFNPCPTTWRDCDLRAWLNNQFFYAAFSDTSERNAIQFTTVDNYDPDTNRRYTTRDAIFLLSAGQIEQYFSDDVRENCLAARAHPSDYAVARGADVDPEYNRTADGQTCCDWWLRSQDFAGSLADRVEPDGSVEMYPVDTPSFCVRPCMWVDLSKLSF